MRTLPTWLGLGVLVALGAFVWFHEIEGAAERELAGASQTRVFGEFDAAAIDRLVLRTTEGAEAHLEREAGRWRMTAPVMAEADPVAAEGLLSALASLDSEASYDEIEALASYGLEAEPQLRFRSGEGEQSLFIGSSAPVGGGVYVTDGEGARVWLVPAWRTTAFRKSLDQLRESRLLHIDPAEVSAVTVRWPQGYAALSRAAGDGENSDSWQLEYPLTATARSQTVETLLSDLGFLRADAFVDEPTAEQLASFETPVLRVEVAQGSEAPPLIFEIGAPGSEGRRLARGPSGVIVEIAEATYQDLPRDLTAFRFRELAHFLPSEAERFSISFADGLVVTAERTASSEWSFPGPALAPGAANRMLSALSRLEASEIAAETMGEDERAGLGLEPPKARIVVFGAEAEATLADVSFGVARGDGALAARRGDGEIVYWLEAVAADQIPVSAEGFEASFRASEGSAPEVDVTP